MTSFHAATPANTQYERAELDDAALACRPLSSIGYGYADRSETPAPQHGWRFSWVATGGMGNCGALVLLPTDRRTWALAREGRILRSMRELDISRSSAEALDKATRGVQYGAELRVLRCVLLLAKCPLWVLDRAPRVGAGIGSWRTRTCEWLRYSDQPYDALASLSCPRVGAAVEIARALF